MNPVPGQHLTPDDFDAWMSGALGPDLREHLAGCPECRERADAEGELVALIAALPLLSPSAGFADRVMQSVSVPDPFALRSLGGIRRRIFATPRTTALAATLIVAVLGSMTASVVWSLGHQETMAAMGSWLKAEAWRAGWITIRSVASNVIEQPWYTTLRSSLDHPAQWGALSAFASLLYIAGIVALRRLLTAPDRQVAHAAI